MPDNGIMTLNSYMSDNGTHNAWATCPVSGN